MAHGHVSTSITSGHVESISSVFNLSGSKLKGAMLTASNASRGIVDISETFMLFLDLT